MFAHAKAIGFYMATRSVPLARVPPAPLAEGGRVYYIFFMQYGRNRQRDRAPSELQPLERKRTMTWTTPTLFEICIGLEINGYLPAEF
jgi:hypothetical protein